jgi:hypothetical protein
MRLGKYAQIQRISRHEMPPSKWVGHAPLTAADAMLRFSSLPAIPVIRSFPLLHLYGSTLRTAFDIVLR